MLSVDEYVNSKYKKEETRRRYKCIISYCVKYFEAHNITSPSEDDFRKLKEFLESEGKASSNISAHVNRTKEYYQEAKTEMIENEAMLEVVETKPEQTEDKKMEAMNFKIEAGLKRRFLILAEIAQTTATDILTKYIEKCVAENAEEVDRYISMKDTFNVKL